MANCSCPLDIGSLSDFCASCLGEYLNVCAQATMEDRVRRANEGRIAGITSDAETLPLAGNEARDLTQASKAHEEMLAMMIRSREIMEAHEKRLIEQGQRILALESMVRVMLMRAKGNSA